jgi:hypothetical protein
MKRIHFKPFDIIFDSLWGKEEYTNKIVFLSLTYDIFSYGFINIKILNFEIELQF